MTAFDYLQIAIVVIAVCVISTKAIFLRVTTGVNPIVIARGKGAWRIIEMLSLASLVLWMTEVVLHVTHSSYDLFPDRLNVSLLHTPTTKTIGAVLVILGLIIFLLAFLNFGKSWRIGIDRQTPGTLVTSGIFGITRNPIYVAFNLFFIGIFLLNGTVFFLIFALMAAVAVHFQILREEAFLKSQYRESFERYRQHVARYLIW